MSTFLSRRLGRALPVILVAATALTLTLPGGNGTAASTAATSEGVLCDTAPGNAFSLTASGGYISTPDGNSIYMWSYGDTGRSFQLPGPTLCVTEGQQVTVVLHNSLPEDTSIIFPGQTHVTANGQPAQPQFDTSATPTLTSLVQPAAKGGGQVTYSFTAGTPGTYLYTSGNDQQKQQQMGLYGALVVRPSANGANHENARSDSVFSPSHEYVYVLSDIDPLVHQAVERGQAADFTAFKPRYFLINGRSMPDTISPNRASWLPSQPYGSLVHIQPYDPVKNPDPALIRYVNAGEVNYPFHPHGSDQRVIARDGHPLTTPAGGDASYDKFLIDVGPGQTWDTLLKWTDVEQYSPANPIPVPIPALQDQIVGPGTDTWFSENPYLGGAIGTTPQGKTQNNQCGEYYHIAHSHALDQATNYGASFGGMMTLIRIDPPSPNNCPAQ